MGVAVADDVPQGQSGNEAATRAPVLSTLDEGWRRLLLRPSEGPALLPFAGGLLAHPDPGVRLRAVHLLAMLGK